MSNEDKTAFEKKMDARIRELDARMQLLQAKADQAAAGAQERGKSAIDDLRSKRDELGRTLESYRNATGSAISELKSGVENAVERFAQSLESTDKTDSAEDSE